MSQGHCVLSAVRMPFRQEGNIQKVGTPALEETSALTQYFGNKTLVPTAGVEPAPLARPAPRAGVSASSTTSANFETLVPAVGKRQAREIMVGSQGVEPRVSRRTAGLRPVAVASAARCPSNWCGRWGSNPWPRRWRRRVLPD